MELPKSNLEGNLASNSKLAKSESQLLIHPPYSPNFHLYDLDDVTYQKFGAPIEIKASFDLPLHGFEVTHSCNGLLLLESTSMNGVDHRCMVWNPVTCEHIILPESIHFSKNVKCAFFVSPTTHQFKVFRAFHCVIHLDPDFNSEIEVNQSSDCVTELDPFSDSDVNTEDSYISSDSVPASSFDTNFESLSDSDSDYSVCSEDFRIGEFLEGGMNSWEYLDDLPFSPFSIYSPCYLNEFTNWISLYDYAQIYIFSFNFETRKFGKIPTPTPLKDGYMYAHEDLNLVDLGGSLSIFDGFTTKGEFHVWVMKEYGVWESWSKDYVIETTSLHAYGLDYCYKPVMCCGNGEVVMICEKGYVLFYDLVKHIGKIMRCEVAWWKTHAMAHAPSIMSVQDAMRGSSMVLPNVASSSGQP